ncbi:hypothetical protein N7520_004489 [Penicillium odoratum]|uniref:uncharacterized protein n=1 Tax=Penicillium odoratum TaxID=1167516 RepID=UPI00254716AC|nr:uncharacterized protein N7520_004489 [Penicillium odoratum]KAJ5764930.1 hypothetical protein N7520_004489 [Penicillium odoratum]
MFRGFPPDELPEPLTVRKRSVSRSHSIGSYSSYPQIPSRSSSLSAVVSDGSYGPASSSRTPSLSESQYQIEIVKVRQLGEQDANMEDRFVDNTPRRAGKGQRNRRVNPRLVVRWSSGSWDSSRTCYPSEAGGSCAELTSEMEPNYLHPIDLPIAFVNVRAATSTLHISKEPTSLWTTVYVSADVSPTPLLGTSSTAPLDIVILLDSLRQPSVNLLTQITLGSSVLASHLMHNHDRISLAYIDGKANYGFEMLLPLSFHSIETVRSALNTFSRCQLNNDKEFCFDIGSVIQRASGIFSHSPRAAFCHMFFVSATPPDHLLLSWIDQAIGFHTITPHACLPLDNGPSQSGWHVPYTVGASESGPRETHFIRRISRVIRQLRTGIRTGSITDVKISIAPGYGCQIQSAFENISLISLRPGETWSIPVQVHVPAASRQISQVAQTDSQHPLIEEMMNRINRLLQDLSSEETAQPLLTAKVEYRHSLLPAPSTIHVDTNLTVIRGKEMGFGASQGAVKVNMGSSIQDSDFSLSIESFSDCS